MTAPCPACGHTAKPDHFAYRDGWAIDPTGFVAFKGPFLRTTPARAKLLHALASATGFMTTDALLNRISRSDDAKVVHVQICNLRKWLAANGLPDPIHADRGYAAPGYRWRNPVSVNAHATPSNQRSQHDHA